MRAFALILGVAMLAGCASTTPQPQSSEPAVVNDVGNKHERVNRVLTVGWMQRSRAGAAVRRPGYIHVLANVEEHDSELVKQDDQTTIRLLPNTLNAAEALGELQSIQSDSMNPSGPSDTNGQTPSKTGYSVYELSRWDRYCDAGAGMDEHDWQFVSNQGADNVPVAVYPDCNPPSYDYQDYLSAWTHFCTAQNVSGEDRSVVANTTRPYTVVDPCDALN